VSTSSRTHNHKYNKKLYRDTIVPTALKNKSAIVKENTNVIREIVHVNDGGIINTNSMRRQATPSGV